MAVERVAVEGRGEKSAGSRYSGTTSFRLVAARNDALGQSHGLCQQPRSEIPEIPRGNRK